MGEDVDSAKSDERPHINGLISLNLTKLLTTHIIGYIP